MQLAKLITLKKIKTLHYLFSTILVLFLFAFAPVSAQDNSPYTRFGIGDLTPLSHMLTRGMGGISAAYADPTSINFNNPASYAYFQGFREAKTKKLVSGRAILDVGMDFESRTLLQSSPAKKFVTGNALFSYIQVGVPLKNNWGLSFGLRPISRISYKLFRTERLKDPLTGLPIDSAITNFTGDGGAYLVSVGTGIDVFHRQDSSKAYMDEKLSFGVNAGFLFGKKDYSTRRTFLNDTVNYLQGNFETKTNFSDLFITAGLMYKMPIDTFKKISLNAGVYGNWGQKISATQDVFRETFLFNETLGEVRLDSVFDKRNVKGTIVLPASYTIGFAIQKPVILVKDRKEGGWMIGADFSMNNWNQYRFYEQRDSVQSNWEIRVGGQISPVPARNYFSNVTYRAGIYYGPDYIKVGQKMNRFGATFGMGLPVALSRQAPNQYTVINVAFEYNKRGNNNNILRENMFRFSLGFSLSDLWFGKRKYE
jgi:hypothetical protein